MVYNIVMSKVNVFEVKAKLSEYLDRAARGERIVICRHNKPVAELRAIEEIRTEPRTVGPLPGRPTFEVASSFFDPLAQEEMDLWDGVASNDPLSPAWTRQAGGGESRVAETKGSKGASGGRRAIRRRS